MEQTGTSIRQLSIKMITMEKTATNLFNSEMKLKNIFVEMDNVTGKLNVTNSKTANSFALTAEMLSNLAKEDAPKAIELLSKLYSNGELSMTTMNKLFTIQHAPYLTQVLTQINGNMDEYNKKMTTGSTVTQAYEQSMESWANQFDRMRQGLSMSNVLVSDFVNLLGGTVLKPIADFGEGLSKIYTGSQSLNTTIKSLISTLIATVGAWKAYSISMRFVKGMQEAFVVNTIASTSAVVSETVAIEGATVATKGFGLALKTIAPMLAIFAGLEIFNFILETMKKEEEQALKSADANNAFAKSVSDSFKNIKDYKSQVLESKKATDELRAKNIYDDWNDVSSVVDKVIGKFEKLQDMQEAIGKLTTTYSLKTDYYANLPQLEGGRNAVKAILAGKPSTPIIEQGRYQGEKPLDESDIAFKLSTANKIKISELYNNYIKTGKGITEFKDILEMSGIEIKDQQGITNAMVKAQEEYAKQTAEAAKQTQIFESSVNSLLKVQEQNLKEFKFGLIGDAINKSDIKNVDMFIDRLKYFRLGDYATRLGGVKDAFAGIVTESGKVDVLKNNLLPLVAGLSTIDNIIADTKTNISLAKNITGREQDVATMQKNITMLEQQKDLMIKNALIEKTHVGIREKISQSYELEMFNLQKVGKGKWEQLQIDKKTLEFNTKLQEELDKNKLDSLKTTINSEFVKYGERGVKSSYSEKELEAKLEELNSKAGKLTLDEEKAQKLILEYKNAQNQAEANKIKAQIQSLQYSIQEKEMLKERTRIYDEFNSLTLNNSQIEHNISQRAFEDWVELAKDKNKSIEAEIAYTKYLLQLNKERKSIVEDMNKFQENRNSVQNIGNQYKILQSTTEKEKIGLQYTITKNNTLSEIASLNNKINLTTTSAIDKETMRVQIEQKKFDLVNAYYDMLRKIYDLQEKTKKATYDIGSEKINRGRLRTNSYSSNPSEDFKNRKSDIDREREFLKTQKEDIENSNLPTLEKEALIKENELAIEKNITAEAQRQYDIHKQSFENRVALFNTISQTIDKISKGEFSSTPSYDLTKTFGKMANSMEKGHGLFGKANLNGKDYAQISNFAITQFSNVWGTINQKHIESINNEITMLDMRKQLATSDEDRQRIDKEILDKRIEAIRLESQTKQQQSIMGGITGGIGTMAAGGFNPVSIGLGVLQMGMGIFGASKADKQAKIQERQLKQQEAIRKATEYTAKFTEMSNNELKKLYASQSLGFDTALGILGKNLKADYKNVMGQSGSINTNISSALSQISKKSDFYTQNKDAWDKIGAPLNYTHTLTASDNYTKFTRELETSIGNLTPTSDFTKVKDDIQALRALWGGGANTGAKANPYIDALNIQLDAWENYINTLEKLSKKRDVFYSAYFGFDVSYIQDTSGKITDIMTGEWKKREDVMNHVVENAKSGANDITKYMGTYITDSIITAWTTNKNSLSVVLNTMETDIKSLFIYMSDVKNKNSSLSDLFKIDTKGKNSLLSPLIEDFKKLNSEQVEINKQSSYLVNAWITLGGAVSDVMSMLPQFSKDLFNGMSEALTQTTFLERFNTVAESISNSLVEKLKTKLMDDSLKSTFMDLNNSITEIMGKDDVTISDALSLRQKIEQSASNMERESQKIQSITDLLSMNKEVNYTSASSQIQYSSGSTTSNVVNMSNSIQIDASGIITMDKTDKVKFANEIAGEMLLALEKKTGRLSK